VTGEGGRREPDPIPNWIYMLEKRAGKTRKDKSVYKILVRKKGMWLLRQGRSVRRNRNGRGKEALGEGPTSNRKLEGTILIEEGLTKAIDGVRRKGATRKGQPQRGKEKLTLQNRRRNRM